MSADYSKRPASPDDIAAKHAQLRIESGALGKFFGTGKTGRVNASAFLAILLLIAIVVLIYVPAPTPVSADLAKTLAGALLLVIGFVCGSKTS